MTEEEIQRFNFLEAAARVYLSHVHKENTPCVKPRTPYPHRRPGDQSYFVRYLDGNFFIVAHIGEKAVMFKQRLRSKNITSVSIERVKDYLKKRSVDKPPAVLLRNREEKPC